MTSRLSTLSSLTRPAAVTIALLMLMLAMGACSTADSGSEPDASDGSPCGVHSIGEVQVRTFCGTGTATAKGGKADVSIPKATCETSADYVSMNAGTIVLGTDAAAKKVKATTEYIGLTVGRVPGDTTSKPASADGSFTGGILSVNDKGTALLPNAKSLKVTLTKDRTAGTFSGSLVGGGTVTGTFTCA